MPLNQFEEILYTDYLQLTNTRHTELPYQLVRWSYHPAVKRPKTWQNVRYVHSRASVTTIGIVTMLAKMEINVPCIIGSVSAPYCRL